MPVINPHGSDASGSALSWIDARSLMLGGGAVLLTAWFGLLRPSQQHLAGLERQIVQLTRTVNDLNDTGDGAKGTNSLLARMQIQGRQLGEAEAAFARFEKLAGRIATQTAAIEQATATLERIDALHAGIAARGPAVGEATTVLDDMADLSSQVEASRDKARAARESLAVLDALQEDLKMGIARVDAAKPVLADVQSLVGRMADTAADIDRAIEIHDRSTRLGQMILDRETSLPGAERTFERMANLTAALSGQEAVTGPAEQRLGRLVALKNSVVTGSDAVDDAAAALTRLHDLSDGLRTANSTIGGLQHMIVDVMLLEPAVNRAVQALKPVIELTRTARQADPTAMSPKPATDRAVTESAQPDQNDDSSAPAANPLVGVTTTADALR